MTAPRLTHIGAAVHVSDALRGLPCQAWAVPTMAGSGDGPRVHVLGSLEVSDGAGRDGPPVPLNGRQGALVAVLAGRPGAVVHAEAIAEAIWGDAQPHDPANTLQGLVSRLRARFGPDLVETRPPGYRLSPDAETDALVFEDLLRQASAAVPEVAIELVGRALATWRGRPFGAYGDLEVLRPEVTRLELLRVGAEERRYRLLLELGRPDDALSGLEAFVAAHPAREQALATFMEALARTGRKAEALRHVAAYRERLVEESGLDPSVELMELEAAILTGSLDRAAEREPRTASAETPVFRLKLHSFERRPGERVTYGEIGQGEPLVFMPGWVSRLDEYGAGTDPRGRLIARLANDCRVVAYDRFGTGLSAGETDDFTVETSAGELVGLLDDLGEPAVTLFASSCSSPVALAVAARDPRVVRIVVFCGFACGPEVFHNQAVVDSMMTLVRSGWGMGSRVLANMLLPDKEHEVDFARFQRRAASPEVAAGFLGQMFSADVHEILDRVEQPVLVMHYRDDPAVPLAGGHQLARGLPQVELVVLEGAYHLPAAADVDRIAQTVAGFCAGP